MGILEGVAGRETVPRRTLVFVRQGLVSRMPGAALYDTIGRGYRERRQPDPRIGERIRSALVGCRSIVNIGAGAGSYEPDDRELVAVEPSTVMIRQRGRVAAPVVQARAQQLPFAGECFDASLAILTIHHWEDLETGLQEMRRVARERVVILTFDPDADSFWLTDYFPAIPAIDRESMPALDALRDMLGDVHIEDVPVPADCTDGFLGAYWRRPEVYLDAEARAAISLFTKLPDVEEGVEALRRDLASGAWARRYGHLLDRDAVDLGYGLVTAELGS